MILTYNRRAAALVQQGATKLFARKRQDVLAAHDLDDEATDRETAAFHRDLLAFLDAAHRLAPLAFAYVVDGIHTPLAKKRAEDSLGHFEEKGIPALAAVAAGGRGGSAKAERLAALSFTILETFVDAADGIRDRAAVHAVVDALRGKSTRDREAAALRKAIDAK